MLVRHNEVDTLVKVKIGVTVLPVWINRVVVLLSCRCLLLLLQLFLQLLPRGLIACPRNDYIYPKSPD